MSELLSTDHKGDPCEYCGLHTDERIRDECLGELLKHIRDIKVPIAFSLEQLSNMEIRAKEAARFYSRITGETGDLIKIPGAKVRITYPKKPRVTWDTKLLLAHSTIYPELLVAKTEKMAAPSVSIKVE